MTTIQDVVRAKKIEIVDDKERPRAILETFADGTTWFKLLNGDGITQAALMSSDDAGGIAFCNKNGRILLSIAKSGLMIWDTEGQQRINLFTGPDGLGARFIGKDGEVVGTLAIGVSGDQLVIASAGPDGKLKPGAPKYTGEWSEALKAVEPIARALDALLKLAERLPF